MLTLFFEHYTIKSARRALIICSFLTIILPGIKVGGTGLTFFGLIFQIEQSTILATMQIISAYFLWVFIWLIIVHISDKAKPKVSELIALQIEKARHQTDEIFNDPHEHERDDAEWDAADEPYWQDFENYKLSRLKAEKRTTLSLTVLGVVSVYSIEYLPPMLAGIGAVFFPTLFHDYLFSLFY